MHSFNLQRVLLWYRITWWKCSTPVGWNANHYTRCVRAVQIYVPPTSREKICAICISARSRAGANTKIYIRWRSTHKAVLSRQQQRAGVYNSITVYLCPPPPLHLNNCKIISVVCVFACHRTDTIFEFIYINRLHLHLLNCVRSGARGASEFAMRPACCKCSSAVLQFSHCCRWY